MAAKIFNKGIWQHIAARLNDDDFLNLGQSFDEVFYALEQSEVWDWRMKFWFPNGRMLSCKSHVTNRTQYVQVVVGWQKFCKKYPNKGIGELVDAKTAPFLAMWGQARHECPTCIYHSNTILDCLPIYIPMSYIHDSLPPRPCVGRTFDEEAQLFPRMERVVASMDIRKGIVHQEVMGRLMRANSHYQETMPSMGHGKTVGAISSFNQGLNFDRGFLRKKTCAPIDIHLKPDKMGGIHNYWYNYKFTMRHLNRLAFEIALRTVDECIESYGIGMAIYMVKARLDPPCKFDRCIECGHEFVLL